MKSFPQWTVIEPEHYITPVLHVEMGLVNKSLQYLITWIDVNIESVSNEEQILRKNMTALAKEIVISKCNHDNHEHTEALEKDELSVKVK